MTDKEKPKTCERCKQLEAEIIRLRKVIAIINNVTTI